MLFTLVVSIQTWAGTWQVNIKNTSGQNNHLSLLLGLIPAFVSKIIGQVNSLTMLSPEGGAKTSLYCALEPALDTDTASGKYYDSCKEASTSSYAQDKDMAKKLWEMSKEIVQLK